jgi:hypothetical protein
MGSLLILLGLLAIPSAIGAVSYFLSWKLQPDYTIVLAEIGLCFVFFGFNQEILLALALAIGSSFFGSWGLTRIETGHGKTWWGCYLVILSATILSAMTLGINLNFWDPITTVTVVIPEIVASTLTIYFIASVYLSPSLMPYLIWMRRSTVMRPGIDKHFEE